MVCPLLWVPRNCGVFKNLLLFCGWWWWASVRCPEAAEATAEGEAEAAAEAETEEKAEEAEPAKAE